VFWARALTQGEARTTSSRSLPNSMIHLRLKFMVLRLVPASPRAFVSAGGIEYLFLIFGTKQCY